MRIKDIALENQPRYRLEKKGVNVLSDAEVIAVVLQSGSCGENVVDMSNRLIATYGLEKLSSLSLNELQAIKGIGPAKASQILALFELSRRCKYSAKRQITSPQDVYEYAYPKMAHLEKEHFMVILLDTKNNVIKDEVISIGTLNSTLVHPREIFRTAIKENANAVILVHNHPSGDCTPSDEDEEITERLKEAGEVLNIKVLDSVVVGGEKRA